MSGSMKKIARDWLQEIMDEKRISPRQLALTAQVSPSTVYRALDLESEFTPTIKTLEKIAARLGVPMLDTTGSASQAVRKMGFAESELSEISDRSTFSMLLGNNQGVWQINNSSLINEGIIPGDKVLIDLGVEPLPGDIVCARIYNFRTGAADTILRVFEPPYLLASSNDPKFRKPMLIDNERVEVVGTMVKLLRERAAA